MESTEKFSGRAQVYAKHRPGYPEQYLDYLQTVCLLKKAVAADVGAGTGILTAQLLARGCRVYAVEPNADMREAARQALGLSPRFVAVDAPAEQTGLAPASIDLITVAQAFHWFDRERFRTECRRILKPGGLVSLVWNSRDLSDPSVQENAGISAAFCPLFKGFSGGMDQSPNVFAAFFREGVYEERAFQNDLRYDLKGFIGRNLSASYAPRPGESNYNGFVEALANFFHRRAVGGMVVIPNLTKSYTGKV